MSRDKWKSSHNRVSACDNSIVGVVVIILLQ